MMKNRIKLINLKMLLYLEGDLDGTLIMQIIDATVISGNYLPIKEYDGLVKFAAACVKAIKTLEEIS